MLLGGKGCSRGKKNWGNRDLTISVLLSEMSLLEERSPLAFVAGILSYESPIIKVSRVTSRVIAALVLYAKALTEGAPLAAPGALRGFSMLSGQPIQNGADNTGLLGRTFIRKSSNS